MEQNQKKRSTFSGKMGFVLSAAGASVGLGNIWRFPYLAAKYGGGIFLLIYIVLALTFGYTMITAETAIGRMTQKSPVGAYKKFGKSKWLSFGGWINAVIPILIVPYYSVIGGWVIKYLAEYIMGNGKQLAADGYFGGFISNGGSAELCFLAFTALTVAIIFGGVRHGVERVSKFMMPVLVVLSVIITIFSVTRPGALEGVKYFLIPNFSNFSWMTVVSAMGQMFYSLSIAMGILITFGSYMKKNVSIEKSTENVEIFDTGIAIMAGLMIIPAVFAFSGGSTENLKAGPSLMFITIPKVFANMSMGGFVGILFFLLVLCAALTSSIALTESAVSTFQDELGWGRKKIDIDHYWYHGIAWYTVLPGIRSARQRPDTRNAVPGFLRLPHKLRDDASSRHCNLPAGVPCDGRQKDRRRNDPGKWHFQTKEDLQLYDQVSVSDFRCGYSDKLGRKCVRYYLNVTYDV